MSGNVANAVAVDEVMAASGVDELAVYTSRLGRSDRGEGSARQVSWDVMGRVRKEDRVGKMMQGLEVDLCRDLTQMVI